MNNGTISGNHGNHDHGGGGVFVQNENASFTMIDGTISGNYAYGGGGGVVVWPSSTFTMKGGTIDDNHTNTTIGVGGGVYISGSNFYMEGGDIKNNTATYGGGVYVYSGTFTKTGGTITGYADDTANGNRVIDSSGTVQSNRGHAVYVRNLGHRDTTAGTGNNLNPL